MPKISKSFTTPLNKIFSNHLKSKHRNNQNQDQLQLKILIPRKIRKIVDKPRIINFLTTLKIVSCTKIQEWEEVIQYNRFKIIMNGKDPKKLMTVKWRRLRRVYISLRRILLNMTRLFLGTRQHSCLLLLKKRRKETNKSAIFQANLHRTVKRLIFNSYKIKNIYRAGKG